MTDATNKAKAGDGGAAFPMPSTVEGGQVYDYAHTGMTLRDWFAGQALAGDYANQGSCAEMYYAENAAKRYYLIADAMLLERKKQVDG